MIAPVDIRLTKAEIFMAMEVGGLRNACSLWDDRKDVAGITDAGWNVHIEGAGGEIAAAKSLNRYWAATVNNFDRPDIEPDIQVRTRSKHEYELLIRPKDADAERFVLVTGRLPNYRIHGWIVGRDAKRDDWVQRHGNRDPAFFVPQSELHSLTELL
jgi:hypothetical protein